MDRVTPKTFIVKTRLKNTDVTVRYFTNSNDKTCACISASHLQGFCPYLNAAGANASNLYKQSLLLLNDSGTQENQRYNRRDVLDVVKAIDSEEESQSSDDDSDYYTYRKRDNRSKHSEKKHHDRGKKDRKKRYK